MGSEYAPFYVSSTYRIYDGSDSEYYDDRKIKG